MDTDARLLSLERNAIHLQGKYKGSVFVYVVDVI